ncbi:hypothetical protein [Arthrobacter sp. 31Y]|uniref:hypothetical protein n=1 Tax=Arthrobacter sp. 31Y TaxID=1115632 RepID=UPI0004679054|nr:hypothetical protein [Arthrobacter sp. 31Y]
MATDPRFAPGQAVNGKTICGAKNKKADPCGLSPAPGATRCGRHGGNSPQAKKAAERRVAEEQAKAELERGVRTLGLPIDIDPGKALLDEIHWTAGHVAWLREKVQELDAVKTLTRGTEDRTTWTKDGDSEFHEGSNESGNPNAHSLVWGQTEYRDKTGGEDAGQTVVEQAGINIWYQLYLKEREHLAKVCALALKAGIEERKVKLAESQGALVADVIRRILAALNLSPAQQAMVPEIVPQQLRLLAGGNAL